jgi:hypothetical protein
MKLERVRLKMWYYKRDFPVEQKQVMLKGKQIQGEKLQQLPILVTIGLSHGCVEFLSSISHCDF